MRKAVNENATITSYISKKEKETIKEQIEVLDQLLLKHCLIKMYDVRSCPNT